MDDKQDKLELSVVTLTWNSDKYIEKMLDSLVEKLEIEDIDYEVFVVDNGSKDNTTNILKKYSKNNLKIKYIPLSENYGTTKSRNIALKLCTKDNIFEVDSDTEFQTTDFKVLLGSFDEIPSSKVGLVHPMLKHPTGEIQNSALKFPKFSNKLKRFFGKETEDYDLSKRQKIEYGISAAWLIKKETLEKIGYLDENIFYAPEDAEYCTRIWGSGLEVWYYPKTEVIHHYQRITKKKKFTKMWFSHLKGLMYYWSKHKKYLKHASVG